MVEASVIELSQSALRNNLEFIRSRIHPSVKVSAVVKANAYGHSIPHIVPMLEQEGVKHFSVFSLQEAVASARAASAGIPVMITGWMHDQDIAYAIEEGFEFFVSDLERARQALLSARSLGIPAKVHLEIETGMNRTGLSSRELTILADWMEREGEWLEFRGLSTHLAGAENIANHVRVRKQRLRFLRTHRRLAAKGIVPAVRHMACSAAMLNYPDTVLEMVRVGILLFGFWPSPETFIRHTVQQKDPRDPLRRVMRWRSRVMSIRDVRKGEYIGYGSGYLAREDRRVAIIPVGYADGFNRTLSNQGRVLIQGQPAPVIGLVNMSMLIADITHLPGTRRDDEVVLIGKQGESEISVASFSEMSDRLNYEALVRLPERIKRTIVN